MLYCEQLVENGAAPAESLLRDFFPKADPLSVQDRLRSAEGRLEHLVGESLNQKSKEVINQILHHVNNLSPVEKLFLYLKLPTGKQVADPLKQPSNPLGSRPEISLTIAWIKTHLKEDSRTSMPKQDVFNEEYCALNETKPLSTADFGKVMKQVYPNVRPRRLGTRGNSRYCYSGMASRSTLPSPSLPTLPSLDGSVVCRWAAGVLGTEEFSSVEALEYHLIENELASKTCQINTFNSLNIYDNENNYILSTKICRPDKKLESDKKKSEEDVSQSPLEQSKRKKETKRSGVRKRGRSSSAVTPDSINPSPSCGSSSEGTALKLPIPRLPKIANATTVTCRTHKRHKTLVPKDLLDNGNSLEQEEELLNYFRRQSEEEPKVSQLRMLLERAKDDKSNSINGRAAETILPAPPSAPAASSSITPDKTPATQKKFSFVPISPICSTDSPFLPPKSLPGTCLRARSCSVSEQPQKKEAPLLLHMLQTSVVPVDTSQNRSQSVPTAAALPQITPVPSEATDFDTDSSNLLVMDSEDSESLLLENGDNLSQILSLITEMEVKNGDPTAPSFLAPSFPNSVKLNYHNPLLDGAACLFDDSLSLDCEDTFDSLAREAVSHPNTDPI